MNIKYLLLYMYDLQSLYKIKEKIIIFYFQLLIMQKHKKDKVGYHNAAIINLIGDMKENIE